MPSADLMLKSAARLLRPLVRLLIQSGVGFPAFADMVRALYVDVAIHDLLTEPERTDSRISLLTGVHRKEIRRSRSAPSDTLEIPPAASVSSQIIARWLGSDRTTDARGAPLPLPRVGQEAGAPSFEFLVRSVTTDIRPRAVLDDFLSQGFVVLEDDDQVRLTEAAYVPRKGEDAQLFYFARNLHDHVAAASANIASPEQPRFLDRSVHYNRLSPEAAAKLERISRYAGQKLLLQINRIAMKLAEADAPRGATRRVNLGVYLFTADDATDDAP